MGNETVRGMAAILGYARVSTTGRDLTHTRRSRCSRWRCGQRSDRLVVLFARVALLGTNLGTKLCGTGRNRCDTARQVRSATPVYLHI